MGSSAVLALVAIAASRGEAFAATWRLTPSASAEVEYTDNVRGVSSGAESDLIFTATPAFNVVGRGARLTLNFSGSLSAEYYSSTEDLSGYTPRMLGAANAELLEDHLFLNTSASYRRSTISRTGSIALGDRNLGSNQSDVLSVEIEPELRFRMGRWASSTSRVSITQTIYDPLNENDDPNANQTSDARTYGVSQVFTSGPEFGKIGWSVAASYSRSDRENNNRRGGGGGGGGSAFKDANVTATVSYELSRKFVPFVRFGFDGFDDVSLAGNTDREGAFWAVGFDARPGPRTTLNFSYGKRFGGNNYEGSLSYRIAPGLNLRASYAEDVTTQQEQELDPFNFVGTDEFGNLIDTRTGLPLEAGSLAFDERFRDVVFRTRTFRMGLTGSRLRNTYGVNWFVTRRDTEGNNARESTISGVTANFSRRLWPDLNLALNGTFTDTDDSVGADTRTYSFGASLNYSLSQSLNSTLSIRRLERTSDGPGDNDLTENSMVLSVRKTF